MFSRVMAAVFLGFSLYAQPAPKQIDVGAEKAPLSDADRKDLGEAIARHNYAAEKAVIDRVAAAHPDSAEVFVMAGRIAYLEKQPKDAADAFERADKLKPLGEADRMTLALAYEFSDRPEPARAVMAKLVQSHPKNAQYLYALGRLDRQAQKIEDAAVDFRKAIVLDPNFLRAYQELGQCEEALGQPERARKTFETAVARNREQAKPWEWPPVDLGALLLKADEIDKAEALFRESLRYSPRFPWAHYYLARVFQQREKHEEAAAEFREAVVAQPAFQQAWLALSREYTRLGHPDEADRALSMFKRLEEQQNARRGRPQ